MSAEVNGRQGGTSVGPAGDEPEVTVARRLVGVVRAEEVALQTAAAGLVFASDEVEIDRGGARDIIAGGPVEITRGGAGLIVSAGDTTIRQGGAGSVISLGGVQIEQGGAGTVAAGSVTVGRGGVIALALSPRIEVADGGRVLGGPVAVVAAVGGVLIGIAVGLMRGRRA